MVRVGGRPAGGDRAGGAALHWHGRAWTPVPTGVLANLNDVWGSGPAGGKVWVAGDEGTVLEYVSRGR